MTPPLKKTLLLGAVKNTSTKNQMETLEHKYVSKYKNTELYISERK